MNNAIQNRAAQRQPPPKKPALTGRALANIRLLTAVADDELFDLRLALEAGADVNVRDKRDGKTALMLAIRGGNGHNVLGSMQETEFAFRREGERIGRAAAGEVPGIISALLGAGAQVNLSDPSGATALHYAVMTGNEGICKELLRRKANVNARTGDGVTPLVLAVLQHVPSLVELLLRAGADPKGHRFGERISLLMLALYPGNPEDEAQDLTSTLRSAMGTVLGGGTEESLREEVFDRLLRAGVDPGEASENGMTPLYAAAEVGSPRIVRRLIALGAKVNATLSEGSTPLSVAASSGRADNVRVLLEAGANPNSIDKDGDTPLILAAEKAGYSAVELLLQAGANVDARNKKRQTARDVAGSRKHTAIVRLLDAWVLSKKH